MKKIVSVLAVAALTLGSVFADISLEFTSKGYLIDSTSTKDKKGEDDTTSTVIFDQDGYADATNCVVFSAKNDLAGLIIDIDPDASKASFSLDQYYGWLNLGNAQFTTGLWTSRYVNRVKEDAGQWESSEYEAYKPGVIYGLFGSDVDNLTHDYSETQRLAFAGEYSLKDVLPGTLRMKAVAVDLTAAKDENGDSQTAWGSLRDKNTLRSGLAFEVAYTQEKAVDVNVLFKTMNKSKWAAAAFVRPLMVDNLNALIGFTYGANSTGKTDTTSASDYYEFGIDLRARYAITDALAITTMNNISKLSTDSKNYDMVMWNMLSGAYKVNEVLKVQFTVENECYLSGKDSDEDIKTKDAGGYNLKFIPGVVINASSNASITTGVVFNLQNVGASSDWVDANGSTTRISVPVVIDIAL